MSLPLKRGQLRQANRLFVRLMIQDHRWRPSKNPGRIDLFLSQPAMNATTAKVRRRKQNIHVTLRPRRAPFFGFPSVFFTKKLGRRFVCTILHSASARRRRGELVKGNNGSALIESADLRMYEKESSLLSGRGCWFPQEQPTNRVGRVAIKPLKDSDSVGTVSNGANSPQPTKLHFATSKRPPTFAHSILRWGFQSA